MKYCAEYAALLDPFVDGELPPEEMARVQAHLAECPGCQAYVDDALAMRAGFPDVEETVVPEGFAGDVMKRIRDESGEGRKVVTMRRPIRRWAGIGALAACCALVILVRTGLGGWGGGYGAAMVTGSGGASEEYAMDTGGAAGSDADGGVSPRIAAAPAAAPPAAAGGAAAPEAADEGAEVPEAAAEEKDEGQNEYSMEDRMAAEEADGGESGDSAAVSPAGTVPSAAAAPSVEAASANAAGRLYLSAGEAGDLLEGFDPAWENAAERGYELTGEEYRALLKALDRAEELPETAEGPFLVVVTGPFA